MNAVDYFKYKKKLVPDIMRKRITNCRKMYDIIVIEGQEVLRNKFETGRYCQYGHGENG